MAYASAEGGGGYGVDASIIHFDPAHADHIRVPDAELLFRGEYQRLGPDLVVTGPDGRHHIIPGYFSSEKHPALVAPNGASLTPDVVDLLAGSPTPGQYAQAQPTTPPDSIGKVEKVIGSVTVVRNGVAVALHVGDAVYKSDVLQTGANSSVGIGFPDGTAINLVANTRMALNDYSFDANSTSNSALFTLVEGTFAFLAGKVAHDGNMKIATPVATMGIRGTTVYSAMVTSSLGELQLLSQLFADYQTGHIGAVEWFDNDPASPTYGQLIDTITDTGNAHYLTLRPGQSPLISVQPATSVQLQDEMSVINGLSHLIDLINNNNQATTPNSGSSTLPDFDVPHAVQPNGGNNTGPFTFNFSLPGLTTPTVITVVVIDTTTPNPTSLPSQQTQSTQNPTSQPSQPSEPTQSNTPPPSGTIVWTASSTGDWNMGPNWQGGSVPTGTNNVQIPVPIVVNVQDTEAASNLVLGPGATLLITGDGALTLTDGLDDFGVVQVGGGDPPMLTISGAVTVEAFALLEAFGEGAQIQLSSVMLSNLGIIEAGQAATIAIDLAGDSTNSGTFDAFDGGIITINANGHSFDNRFLMEAFGEGTQIQLSSVSLSNLGIIEAAELATITISLNGDSSNSGTIDAFNGGVITINANGHGFDNQFLVEAFGEGTHVQLSNVTLSNPGVIEVADLATITISLNGDSSNSGTIEAFYGGLITLNDNGHEFANQDLIEASNGGGLSIAGDLTNSDGANIEAIGPNAFIALSEGALDNQSGARIEASHRGSITLDSETVSNESGAKIEATHLGTITFDVGSVTNDGTIEAKHYGSISFEGSVFVKNNFDGTIEATKYGSITLDGGDGSDGASGENDGGTILAKDHGAITFENIGFTNQDGGIIEAKNAGTIIIDGAPDGPAIFNDGGMIAAIGLGSTVQIIDNATVHGGSFDVEGGALFVDGTSTLTGSVNVSIAHGGFADFASVVNANGADVSVAFAGMGTLELDQQPAAPFSVTGFGIGDAIDLTNVSPGCVSLSLSDGSLTISEFGTSVLTLQGDYSLGDFTLVTDVLGGTEVFFGNDVWENTAGGEWTQTDGSNWSNGVPNPSKDVVIGQSGVYTVTIVPVGNDESGEVKAGSLAISDAGATLTGTGMLTVETTLDNAGTIDATGCDGLSIETDTLINEYSGVIAAFNGGNLFITDDTDGTNYGLIKAANGGALTINHDGTAANEIGATIEAVNNGDITFNDNLADANYGLMKAANGGSITINVDDFDPTESGVAGGNFGKMEAVDGGTFSIVGDMFNASGATMKAVGEGSQFNFSSADYEEAPTLVGNVGTILAADYGAVTFCAVGVGNQNGAIVATDYGTVTFNYGAVQNDAGSLIVAENFGTITFDHVNSNGGLTNLGTVEALGWGSLLSIDHSTVTGGTLTADGGTLYIGGSSILSNVAIVITGGGIAEYGDALIQGVTFSGDGTLELDHAPGAGAAVTGFGANDVLDLGFLDGIPLGCLSLSWLQDGASGTLTVSLDDETQAAITLEGTYDQDNFVLLSDPFGNAEVVYGVQQIWTGGTSGQWNTAANWNDGAGPVPGATDTAIIDNAGHQPVTITDAEQVANLVIDSGAELDIDSGGLLTVTNALDVAGTIDVNATGSDPFLLIDGPVRVESDAEIVADGDGGLMVEFLDDQVGNAGDISANGHGAVLFEGSAVFNQDGGVIEATSLSAVTFDNATVNNQGGATIEANGGQVLFDHSTITNDESHNSALIEATGAGTVSFVDSSVAGSDGSIQAVDPESVVKLAGSTIDGGEISGEGTLEVAGSSTLKGYADVSVAQINVEDGVTLRADHVSIDGSTINLGHAATGQGPSFTEISVPDVNAIGPSISADGEFVAFIASDNLPGQGGDLQSGAIELYDAATGKLTDISAAVPALPAGETSLGFSNVPSISADGRYVVFDEKYEIPNNQGPPMETSEVLLYDRQSQTATVVRTFAGHAEISGDGQYIVMQGDTIPDNNSSFGESVLVTDRAGNILTTISGDPGFTPPENSNNFGDPNSVYDPAISSGGRFVTFWTTAAHITVDGTPIQTGNDTGNAEVYIYDRLNDRLQMVSAAGGTPGDGDSGTTTLGNNQDSSWPSSMSADGRYVVFQSSADNLVGGVGDAAHDVSNVFLYDTQTGTITAITHADSPSAVGSIRPEISADGTLVTFASDESDLPGANGIAQTYSYDTQTQTTHLVSGLGDQFPANAESDLASAVSANGSAIAFGSLADNLVIPTANGGNANIYLAAPGTIAVTGDTTIDDNATINNGTVIVDNCVTLTLSDVVLNGTFVQVGAGANLDLLGAIHNNATLEADGGTIFANSNTTIDGTGNVVITGGGLAHFADVFNQDVTFAGPGTLQLDQSVIYDGDALTSSYTGTISGFGTGDTIDLTALNYSCTETDVWNSATHALIISNGTQTQLLSLAGSYTQDNFALVRDSSGGTEVVLSPTHVTLDGLDDNGNAEEDHSVTVTPSADDLSNVTYTWLVGGQDVQDGSSNTYTPAAGDVGKTLDVLVSFIDPVTHSVEHVTALGGTVDALPGLAITGTSATGSVPSSALTPTAASYLTADHDLIDTLGGPAGFGSVVLFNGSQTSDDGSSPAIDITSFFGSQGLNFFGHQYTSLYINNNGNITFAAANSQFTPDTINGGVDNPIIAPFWADVDTRGGSGTATPGGNSTGSNLVYESLDTTNDVLTITWDDVGYYSEHTNLLDAFQLQLVSLGNGDFDIVFRYENINWTTGDFSGGSGGLGGTPARAGYSAGDDNSGHYFELSGSGDQSSMLALPSTTGNTGIQGVYVFQVESGAVTSAPVANGAIQFSDADSSETNTASFVALNGGVGYVGTFSLDPVSETNGTGSVAWHFALASNDVQQFFSPSGGSPITQAYDVTIAGDHGSSTTERVSLTVGTAAADVFDFIPGIGQDLVFEFSNQSGAADKIELSNFGFTDFSQLQLESVKNGNDTLISNLGGGDSITLVGVKVADLQSSDFIFSNDAGGDPAVVPGTFNVVGDVALPAPNPADTLTASFTPEGSNYVGTFTLDQPAKSNGAASLGFEFDLGNDQINLAPGQTLTQSYDVSVTDAQNPAMNISQTVSVSIGGPGNDNFVFKPGVGLDTIVNFDPAHDTIELDHFTNIQSVQQLESLITSDAHGDAVIALGHHDSITVAGVTAAQLQQLAQAGHVLLH